MVLFIHGSWSTAERVENRYNAYENWLEVKRTRNAENKRYTGNAEP